MLTEEEILDLLEEKEINDFIDEAADGYQSPEEILREQGLSLEQAVREADAFRNSFFAMLQVHHFSSDNISRICQEVAALTERDRSSDTVFLYAALLTENGLLFGAVTDHEQKALLWLQQKERVDLLTRMIAVEPVFSRQLAEIRRHKPLFVSLKIDRQEQAVLYGMVIQNTFLYQSVSKNEIKRNTFLQNIGELVRLVNADELYRSIKPYIYFAVLSRRHTFMTDREHYSPNIPKMFDYQAYTIYRDNKKNFDTYQSYLELYAQLRESYEGEIDEALTDYCMANTSNLCEWFYENCEPDDAIPMRLSQVADFLSNSICLESSNSDVGEFDLGGFIEANPVFEIACQNLLCNAENWKDFVAAIQNGGDITPYAERLYREALKTVPSSDEHSACQYAAFLLFGYMEEYNRKLLVSAAKNFMTKE